LKSCSSKLSGIDLSSLLITPVQRIPRYELLLKELINCTWETHPDYTNLEKALQTIKGVASTINEKK